MNGIEKKISDVMQFNNPTKISFLEKIEREFEMTLCKKKSAKKLLQNILYQTIASAVNYRY
jgi:hypothetical protein